jgi:hypothetical protein
VRDAMARSGGGNSRRRTSAWVRPGEFLRTPQN